MADTAVLQSVQTASQLWSNYDWTGKRSDQDVCLAQVKEHRDSSLAARKVLADTTKQFKRSVKAAENASQALQTNNTPETAGQTVTDVDVLVNKCRFTVKSYQEEIDNLTRRCKASESAYSSLCHSLQEVPNPADVLDAAMEQMNAQQAQMAQLLKTNSKITEELHTQEQQTAHYQKEAEKAAKSSLAAASNDANSFNSSNSSAFTFNKEEREELVQLRREVAEYEVEFRSLKNQDISIRKLESRIVELQTHGQAEFEAELQKTKDELQETEGRRAAEALEREAAMERKVQLTELQLKAERAGREATQEHLLDQDEGVSQREAAWEAQRRILVDDSERVRENLQAAVRERDELRLAVAAVQGGDGNYSGSNSGGSGSGGSRNNNFRTGPTPPPSGGISLQDLMLERKAYEAEVAELSETAALLRDEFRAQEDATVDDKRGLQSRIDSLEREKASLKSKLTLLENQVASAPSQALVENMKRELRILKRLEYNADDVDADRDPEIAGGAGSGDEEKDLETVLVGKLRRAESELVTERTNRTDLVKKVDSLTRELADAEQAKDEAEKLVSSLELDLERAIVTPSTPKTTRKTVDMVPLEENPATLQSILDPNAPPPPARPTTETNLSVTPSGAEKADDDHSVATIVMAQRDRLRARCEALEAERDSFKRELQGQVQASESLKADNTKLYEKVRYLQNYNKAAPSNSRGAYSRNTSGASGDRDLDLEALEQRYEASVDPFRQFNKSERQRKLNDMSPMERTVFMVAKTVLGK
jgi:homeobox protein cut-like